MADEITGSAENTSQVDATPQVSDEVIAPAAGPDAPEVSEAASESAQTTPPSADAQSAAGETGAGAAETGQPAAFSTGNLEAEIAAALAAAQAQAAEMGEQLGGESQPAAGPAILGVKTVADASAATPLEIPQFPEPGQEQALANLDLLDDVELDVKIELGRAHMYIEDVLRLGVGSVVELDKLAGDPVDIYVNDRLVARGEVLVLNDNFCVRVNDIISPTLEEEEKQSA